MKIPEAIKQMISIVEKLRKTYSHKKFTLDGRLIGDIGEILVENKYDVKLFEGVTKHHDGICSDGRHVQIKTTMKESLTFPVDHTPKVYIGIKVHQNGSFTEIFNGPGKIAKKAVKNRKPTKTNLHSINIGTLLKLNKEVLDKERIPIRAKKVDSTNVKKLRGGLRH